MNDLELLLTPDPDFDQRLNEFSSVKTEVPWLLQSKTIFPEIIADFSDDIDVIVKKESTNQNRVVRQTNSWLFPEITFDDTEEKTEVLEENKPILSELEIQKSVYASRFQEILEIWNNSTQENFMKRYAKILLYILEQFHIFENDKRHHNWDKKYFLKFMIDLKKILGEINNEEQEKKYKENILKRPYVKISWELKEEIELLFNMYYSSYIDCQRQIHEKSRLEELEKRRRLEENISKIEEELDSQFNLDELNNETLAQREIRLRREELAKKRVQRDSQLSQ